MRTLSILGSTGSIGEQTLDILEHSTGEFEIFGLGAYNSIDKLCEQAAKFHPKIVAIGNEKLETELRDRLDASIEVRAGASGLVSLAHEANIVMNAIVGFEGLKVTLATLTAKNTLLLANKESLVAGGELVRKIIDQKGSLIVPVDSEHSAIHQCLRSGTKSEVKKLILTGSGGPFRGKSIDELRYVTVEEALNHPTWKMGPKITVDSSTLMNKGLEVIEAKMLFDVDYDLIDVVIHAQSKVHSIVEFVDGSQIAQLSNPDMRLPIGYALNYPDRCNFAYGALDYGSKLTLTFEPPDIRIFKCLDLSYEAARKGGSFPAALNAANEVAVESFLDHKIDWLSIATVIESVLENHDEVGLASFDDVINVDEAARSSARRIIDSM